MDLKLPNKTDLSVFQINSPVCSSPTSLLSRSPEGVNMYLKSDSTVALLAKTHALSHYLTALLSLVTRTRCLVSCQACLLDHSLNPVVLSLRLLVLFAGAGGVLTNSVVRVY
jgi:hypothetical protein